MLKSIYPAPESWQINKDIKSICEKTHAQTNRNFLYGIRVNCQGGEKRYFLKDNNGLVSRCKPISCHKGNFFTTNS